MDHGGAGSGWSLGLHMPDEAQQAGGMEWHTVVGPASEMELSDFSDLGDTPLKRKVGDTQVRGAH